MSDCRWQRVSVCGVNKNPGVQSVMRTDSRAAAYIIDYFEGVS